MRSIGYHTDYNSTNIFVTAVFFCFCLFVFERFRKKKTFSKMLHSTMISISCEFLGICLYCDRVNKLASNLWNCPTIRGKVFHYFFILKFRLETSIFNKICPLYQYLAHWGRDKSATCCRKLIFVNENCCTLIQISLKFVSNWPLTRYVKLRFAHAPGMPGMVSLPSTSKETAS